MACISLKDYMSPVMASPEKEEALDYFKAFPIRGIDLLIFGEIDKGNKEIISIIKEAILSENNNVLVTREMISGIVKSSNKELHELLCKLLVAARLQEGLRQVICEVGDNSTKDFFYLLLKTIDDNKLLRFSAVKRAIGTWCGIFDYDNPDRITEKIFGLILSTVEDKNIAYDLLKTNDSTKIVIGLWRLGFDDVDDAVAEAKKLADSEERNTILTASYYAQMIQGTSYGNEIFDNVVDRYPEDLEIIAAYLPCCLMNIDNDMDDLIDRDFYKKTTTYNQCDIGKFFASEEKAYEEYDRLKRILPLLKKNKITFFPIVFPWHKADLTKSDVVVRMAFIAYVLEDQNHIDEICSLLSLVNADGYPLNRSFVTELILHEPKTKVQRNAVLEMMNDKAEYTRKTANDIVKDMKLDDSEYQILEGHLKYKNAGMRLNVINILKQREDIDVSINRMAESKDENIKIAAVDLIKGQIEKDSENKNKYISLLQKLADQNDKQQVIIDDILKEDNSLNILNAKGYGLYDPDIEFSCIESKANYKKVNDYFSLSKKQFDDIFDKMEEFVNDHSRLEYKNCHGETVALGNGLSCTSYNNNVPMYERYPFFDLWMELYDRFIKDEKTFWNVYVASSQINDHSPAFTALEDRLFKEASKYRNVSVKYSHAKNNNGNLYNTILRIINSYKHLDFPYELCEEIALAALDVDDEDKWIASEQRYYGRVEYNAVRDTILGEFVSSLLNEKSKRYEECFAILYRLDDAYQFSKRKSSYANYYNCSPNLLDVFDYLYAYDKKIISIDEVYKAFFEKIGIKTTINELSILFTEKTYYYLLQKLSAIGVYDKDNRKYIKDSSIFILGKELYFKIVDVILNVELKRGESATVFSEAISSIVSIYGTERLGEVLLALGKDPFDRGVYYSWYSKPGKNYCLCHLLKNCYPLDDETYDDFKEVIDKLHLSPSRLSELAMYAPQWMDWIEEYLDYPGFSSGCYYFMAHMNERFDERKIAHIARYTPLSTEELNDGCFDSKWFYEVYEMLGEKRFNLLYDAAKYIADGSKHARARKYADAATSKVTQNQLEKAISDKRNKDLLMSYGILPVADEKDKLHRYEFLQRFLKESKKFGSLRKASESKAVDIALKNLATNLGYADSLRLILAMESALVDANSSFFGTTKIKDYELKVIVDGEGQTALSIQKDGKAIKGIPAAIKSDEQYQDIKAFVAKLKQQRTRCISMFESAMENKETYSLSELKALLKNPVIKPLLTNLVLTNGKKSFLIEDEDKDEEVRFAHPYDLYVEKSWSKWQSHFLKLGNDFGIKQPFKQVFRELYLKLDEELDSPYSRMYAGNQIQAKKAVAALKSRKWIVDEEEGLQKVYYKDNIIATIYALADWFSPSDIEPPTVEYVCFYDRKDYKLKPIKEIGDIIYSEVMRDADLAVSIAHAGGVDPETSHSTIEMRAVIAKFNVELFKLDNVSFEKSHAYIKGKFGEYTVHLGSGVIHKSGLQINILPVASQSRGKIFLPFVDEDPKTAEIISKILLLARDDKIKDPSILSQIS